MNGIASSAGYLRTCDAEDNPGHSKVEVDGDAVVCVLVEYSGCLLQQLNRLLYCCWLNTNSLVKFNSIKFHK